jgi:hypothetical protein
LTDNGWQYDTNGLKPIWDTDTNITNVVNKVEYLTKGCKCKTGCRKQCGCKKAGRQCGPSCCSVNCVNVHTDTSNEGILEDSEEESSNTSDDDCYTENVSSFDVSDTFMEIDLHYKQLENEVDLIMTEIFGDEI